MWIIGIIIAVILIIAIFIYISMKKSLTQDLGLKVELDPPQVEKGQDVRIKVILNPREAIRVESITGTLFCRRYDEYKNTWQYTTDNPHVSIGETIARIEFTFGENLDLEPGKEAKFGGKVPLPSEGMATEIRGMIQVHWFVTIHVKVPGRPDAEVKEELIVTRPLILDGDEEGKEEVDLYDPFYDARKELKKSITLVSEKAEDKEAKPGEKAPAGVVAKKEEVQEPKRPEIPKEKEEEKEPAVKSAIRDKYKVKYHAPFDPTKHRKAPQAVTSEDYMKAISSSEEEKKPASRGEVADIYKKRHFVPSRNKDKKSKKIDLSNIPEEYRTHHKLARSSKDQKIIDEKYIPEEYRSGYKKPGKE